jgi:hypothetical protein
MQMMSAISPVAYLQVDATPIINYLHDHPRTHAPPRTGTVSPNILHCVFRI